ncbi:Arylamine n-acetyltransferase 1 [Mycena indigotica]|uniref:Arylamine n-acetyltransferase 1 n=1 Tax=Mycena indigotica TaxID=2126181 RepID=A0A8H6RYL0_9AGAR|nr:Arylamine n-acetyltransferase 1 [Mycena indigotica]KAF7289714.1 Arylamine n-acetyltransferase 1 [Mycena indigotica]
MSTEGRLRDDLWIAHKPSGYTSAQAQQWLAKINYPTSNLDAVNLSLETLTRLVQLSVTTFPFENTAMHYTAGHTMDVSYPALFDRLVAGGTGAGSWCYGLNGLFYQMLLALGFRVYAGAGRINPLPAESDPQFLAFVHMVLFVQPTAGSNATFVVDTASALVRPIPLCDGAEVPGATPTERFRLRRAARPEASLRTSPDAIAPAPAEWWLEHIQDAKDTGMPPTTRVMYSFIEDEFFETERAAGNATVLAATGGIFAETVVCSKYFFLTDEEAKSIGQIQAEQEGPAHAGEHLGKLAMGGNVVRKHVGLQTTLVKELENEADRVDALRECFGIIVLREEVGYMEGRQAALK